MYRAAAVVVSAVMMVCTAAPMAHGQSAYMWLGAGATIPVGDSKDSFKTGWLADAGVGFPLMGSTHVSLQIQGLYGSSGAKVVSGSTSLFAGLVNLSYGTSPDVKTGAYFYVGGGYLSRKPEGGPSDGNGAYQVGGGLSQNLSDKLTLWADLRYLVSGSGDSKLQLMPVVVGVSYTLGSPR